MGSGVQPTHLRDTDIVRETSLPSIQLNQEKVMKIMVKIMVGKMSLLIRDDFIACERHYKSQCAGHWASSHERRESTAVALTVTGFPNLRLASGGFTTPWCI